MNLIDNIKFWWRLFCAMPAIFRLVVRARSVWGVYGGTEEILRRVPGAKQEYYEILKSIFREDIDKVWRGEEQRRAKLS